MDHELVELVGECGAWVHTCVYLISWKHVYFDKGEIQRRKRSDSEKQLTQNIHISLFL
jgi:hypothetical protein